MNPIRFTVATGKNQQGFTLIELMVVTVIVAILAAVGYPSYIQYTTKSKRAAAESFMLSVANKEEQVVLDMRNYVSVASKADFPNAPAAGSPGLSIAVPNDVSTNYNIAVVANNAATPPTYTITATPIGSQLTNDTTCGILTLTQTGAKTPAAGCW